MSAGRSPEDAYAVRTLSAKVAAAVTAWPTVWVEGQIAQMGGSGSTRFLSLRDSATDVSIPVRAAASTVQAAAAERGHAVVARVKPEYFPRNGSLTWYAVEIRPIGVGALLQRLHQLKVTLAAEGLFRDDRKRPLPFLPRRIGLVCGRASAARRDVEVNARRQWPGAVFEVREVAVTGPSAALAVGEAIAELDAVAEVDVIVVTRGGGSFEELLPFSNESLLRVVAEAATPVVSAIGHEEDTPLLDLVADARASTPTGAGKMVVPDLAAELRHVREHTARLRGRLREILAVERRAVEALRHRPVMASPGTILTAERVAVRHDAGRARRCVDSRIVHERALLDGLTSRPVLRNPAALLTGRRRDAGLLRDQLRTELRRFVGERHRTTLHLGDQLRALSPQGTLDRGYAVVRTPAGQLVTAAAAVGPGDPLRIRVADGAFGATVAPTPDLEGTS